MEQKSILKKILDVLNFDEDESGNYEKMFNEFIFRATLDALMFTADDLEKEELKKIIAEKRPLPDKYWARYLDGAKEAAKTLFTDFIREILPACTRQEKESIDAILKQEEDASG